MNSSKRCAGICVNDNGEVTWTSPKQDGPLMEEREERPAVPPDVSTPPEPEQPGTETTTEPRTGTSSDGSTHGEDDVVGLYDEAGRELVRADTEDEATELDVPRANESAAEPGQALEASQRRGSEHL